MRRRKNKKFIIIILILFISIGFAYLSASLNITGLATIKRSVWDVHFENIVNENEDVLNIDTPAVISNNKLRVDFEVSLDQPGQEYSFYVDVLNNSTFDVALSNLSITGLDSSLENYIIPTVTYSDGITPLQNDILKENSLETLRVSVKYNDDLDTNNLPTTDSDFQLSVQLTYIQADNNSKERKHLEYINRQTPGVISVGDEIAIDTEHFYVVSSNEDKTVLLSKYNLYVGGIYNNNEKESDISESAEGYGLQNSNAIGVWTSGGKRIATVDFSKTSYWLDENEYILRKYYDESNNPQVYDTTYNSLNGDNYSIAYYVLRYDNYLKQLGLNTSKARLLKFSEIQDLGCESDTCANVDASKQFIYLTSFWLETASTTETNKIYQVLNSSKEYRQFDYKYNYGCGVRPVIEINTDFLKNTSYKIIFDSNGGVEATPFYAYKDKDSKVIDDYFDVFIVDENTNGYGGTWSAGNMEFSKIADSNSPTGMALHTERVADGTTGGGTFGISLIEGEYYRETYIYKAYGDWSIGHYRLGRMSAPNTEEYKTITHAAKATNNKFQSITNYDYNTTAGDYFDLAYGKITHLLPETKRTGYTFAGWWTEKDGGTRITNTTKVTENKIYYAHWTKN